MSKKNIALIGAGYWGKNLLRNFYELGSLKYVVELNDNIVEERKKTYPDLIFIKDINQVWNDNEIEGVAIATPAIIHYKIAKDALLHNKDVFVEKPLALKVNNGEELVKIAEENNKILMVGHILQYHSAVIKLKELIQTGELGKINYIYSNRLNMGKLRTEENVLWSFAPHDISVVLGLIGDFPIEISSNSGAYLQENINDITLINFKFKNGIKGHIFVSWLNPFKEQKLVVVGSKNMAVFDDTSENKLVLYPHSVEWKNNIPTAVKAEGIVVELEKSEPLKMECSAFLESIKSRKSPITDGAEGLRVLKFLTLADMGAEHNISNNTKNRKFFSHPTAVVEKGADIGEGTKIWHYTHIMKGAKIGKNCNIGQNVYVDKKAVIGNRVKIQNNVSVYDDVILEDEVFCGPSMVFTNVINPRSHIERKDEYKRTLVKKRASIGANATIVCGNSIGRGAFVGAGAVVTKDVPDYALVVGNPARVVGWMCECGVKLQFDGDKAKCSNCGAEYKKDGDDKIVKI